MEGISNTRLGAFAIIQDGEGRYLCSLRRDMDLWNLPGGGVEHRETPWDAVVREVREETGLSVKVERLQGIYAKEGVDTLVFSFVCSIVSGELVPTHEAREHRYFALDELPLNISPKQRERLEDYESNPGAVTMKKQTLPSSREHLAALGHTNCGQ